MQAKKKVKDLNMYLAPLCQDAGEISWGTKPRIFPQKTNARVKCEMFRNTYQVFFIVIIF